MAARKRMAKKSKPKTVLRLPDLEQSQNAVLKLLPAASSQESYGHAIDKFIGWYCSEPRLAFNQTVVLRYRADRRFRSWPENALSLIISLGAFSSRKE
jgi:hypothetical protein